MAIRRSAGLLLFRRQQETGLAGVEVLIGHMGGPFWARRDERAWSIPKGEYEPPEEALAAARREFAEELGLTAPVEPYQPLGELRQSGGKIITAWAVEADLDPATVTPGTFTLEWPPRSGAYRDFPEIDRVEWCTVPQARSRLVLGQVPLLDRLVDHLRR